MTPPRADKPPSSCKTCFSWGQLPGYSCRACFTFASLHEVGQCSACRRSVPTKKSYCRLCWLQASLEAKTNGDTVVLAPYLAQLRHQQLFLARMHRIRQPGPLLGKAGRRPPRQPPAPEPARSPSPWMQISLLDTNRDYRRFDRRRDQDLGNPWLVQARHSARELGEARGWTHWTAREIDRALVIALSGFTAGDTVRYCELLPALRERGLSTRRTAEVLNRLGLFQDDRPTVARWLDRKLEGVAPGIRHDAENWAHTLLEGGPRSRPRGQNTVWHYLSSVGPVLLEWSNHHGHLREVTREEVRAVADSLQGNELHYTLSALRSLFRHCHTTGTLFRDPTVRIRRGRRGQGVIHPLAAEEIHRAVASWLEEIEWRERTARERITEIEAELAALHDELAGHQGRLSRLEITRETMTEIFSAAGEPPGPGAGGAPVPAEDADGPDAGLGPPVGVLLVPPWTEGRALSGLPQSYRDIVELLTDAVRPMRAKHIAAALGLPPDASKVEGLRSKLKRLTERGWITEDGPGLFACDRSWPGRGRTSAHTPTGAVPPSAGR